MITFDLGGGGSAGFGGLYPPSNPNPGYTHVLGNGNDSKYAWGDGTSMHMGGGNDYFTYSRGDNMLVHGGTGNDFIEVGYYDRYQGRQDANNNTIYGGEGNDTL